MTALRAARLSRVPTGAVATPEALGDPVERASATLCVCGHGIRQHGDRVTGACDGGFKGGQQNWTGRALCPCGGWERVKETA